MKRILIVLCIILFIFSSCSKKQIAEVVPSAAIRTITDLTGREVTIPLHVTSIICVNVGTLRFTTYMQALDLVAGVEQNEFQPSINKLFSYINRERLSALPAIGDNGKTFDEEIIKISPEVIMAAFDRESADALQAKTGIPVVTIPLIDDAFDEACFDTLRLMGEVYDKKARAEELIAYIKTLNVDFKTRIKDIKPQNKPSVYAGGISFKGAHGFEGTEARYSPFYIIDADNVADRTGQNGAFNIDVEQVLKWDPDIIFLDFNGLALIKEDYAKRPAFYNSFNAVKNNRVYSQISFRFNAVNIELAFADAYYAAKVIYPEQFADIDPAVKADEIFEKLLGVKCYEMLEKAGYAFRQIGINE
ncbi:Fe3+-siderophore ABC transporter, periplasmic Fe3+-siderophore-binding protein [Treponema primitia ZAS-2]|uniref:Fe3+-siderophore ABC transporter, periplasmic Fe3+-siderophore-binding protein n=1 Tax=Treponema primitia (strain ATCC BAA-887 / DSM 12427 / ZAS-2) TaxID=545694 RepID=F5YKU8_TREPZ|nr:ABC transporter substrate-binding protein [Treponema primitia]AEF85411.1 Fe3+-siderophore ABC transporter, periplasmic Fe3+-siderophore-binding protein [Treponema primitia ZAS-2]